MDPRETSRNTQYYETERTNTYSTPTQPSHNNQNPIRLDQQGELRLPDNATVTINCNLDSFSMHLKYLSSFIDSIAQVLVNGCITMLTWISAQNSFTQSIDSDRSTRIFETINSIAELAKKQLIRAQQQPIRV